MAVTVTQNAFVRIRERVIGELPGRANTTGYRHVGYLPTANCYLAADSNAQEQFASSPHGLGRHGGRVQWPADFGSTKSRVGRRRNCLICQVQRHGAPDSCVASDSSTGRGRDLTHTPMRRVRPSQVLRSRVNVMATLWEVSPCLANLRSASSGPCRKSRDATTLRLSDVQ